VQPLGSFPAFYGTRRLIIEFTRALHLYLSWARPIQSKTLNPISKRSILLLSIHLRLGLPSGLFPSGFLPLLIRNIRTNYLSRNIHNLNELHECVRQYKCKLSVTLKWGLVLGWVIFHFRCCRTKLFRGDVLTAVTMKMASSGLLRLVTLVRTDVSVELSASIIRVTRIGDLGTRLSVTRNRRISS
jgi:hypothetical protein